MDLDKFKNTIKNFKENAIKIICELENKKLSDIEYVIFDEEDAEVAITDVECMAYDDMSHFYIEYEKLIRDPDEVIAEMKAERAEKEKKIEEERKRIAEEEERTRKRKDLYEKLKNEFEK